MGGDAHAGASNAAGDVVMVAGPVAGAGDWNRLGRAYWVVELPRARIIVDDVGRSWSLADGARGVLRIGFRRAQVRLRVLILP